MSSGDGYSDDEFIEEDVEGDDSEGEAELEAKIAEEHAKFKQAQEERQAKVRETRTWSAPPLESPKPEEQKERKIESAKMNSPEAAAAVAAARADYEPPPPGPNRPSYAGKPSLDNILEDEESTGLKVPVVPEPPVDGTSDGDAGAGAGSGPELGSAPPAAAAQTGGTQGVEVGAGAAALAVVGAANGKQLQSDEGEGKAEPGVKVPHGGDVGAGKGGDGTEGRDEGKGEDEEEEEEEEEEEKAGGKEEGKGAASRVVAGSTVGSASGKAGGEGIAGRWVVGDTSTDSIVVPKEPERPAAAAAATVSVTVPTTGHTAAVMVTTVPAAASIAPGTTPVPASVLQADLAAQLAESKPAATVSVPTTLPPSSHALGDDDSDVSIAEDDGESLDEAPLLQGGYEKEREKMRAREREREEVREEERQAALPPKPLGVTLPQGSSPSRTAPWATKPGRYDGVAASDGGSAWGAESVADSEAPRRGKREPVLQEEEEEAGEALMEPHEFALKLLMHDLRTLPAHRKAVAAAAPPSSRRPASAKHKSRHHDAAAATVDAMLSGKSPRSSSRPASAPLARGSAATEPSGSKPPSAKTTMRVMSAVPHSRGPPSTTSSSGWSAVGARDSTLQMSRVMRATPEKRDRLAASGAAQAWDNGSEDQEEPSHTSWTTHGGGARQRPFSARPTQGGGAARVSSGVPPRARPLSAQLPSQAPRHESWEGGGGGAWRDAGGDRGAAAAPQAGRSAAVTSATSIYTADTQKQIASANRCLVALGSRLRYQMREPTDPMHVQVVKREVDEAGEEWLSVVKDLTTVEFMSALRTLKDRVRQQQQSGGARTAVRLDGYGTGLDAAFDSPVKALWDEEADAEADGGVHAPASEPSNLIYRHADTDDWLLGGGGYDGMGPDASMPPPLAEVDEAQVQPSVVEAVHMEVSAAAQRCQELAMRVSMLRRPPRSAAL